MTWLVALGGVELFRFLVQHIVYRRANRLQKEATALREQVLTQEVAQKLKRSQTDFLEDRLKDRDRQIDQLYRQLRKEQTARFELQQALHEAIQGKTLLEFKRCEVFPCSRREPPLKE